MPRTWAATGAALALAVFGGGIALATKADRERPTRSAAPSPARTAPAAASVRAPASVRAAASTSSTVDVLAGESPGQSRCERPAPPPRERLITRPTWVSGVTVTEYYPAAERWFRGVRVATPGVPGRHAVDWLVSARGIAMEGDGTDLAGHHVHISELGSTGWVNGAGRPTVPVCLGKWSDGSPVWLRGGWRNARGAVTFPLAGGGWANGGGVRRLGYGGVAFSPGSSLPLHAYHTLAVDPRLIPLGSRVYIPFYRGLGGGWFVAQDTGGAIKGRHVDVYRPAPASPDDQGRYLAAQRILVIPPG